MLRHWISCIGGNSLNDMLRPEIISEGYGWLNRRTLESIDAGLQPLWHCPLGNAAGCVVPTTCGPSHPRFHDLWDACGALRSYAFVPDIFTGMRFHDPHSLVVDSHARWIDASTHADKGVLHDNLNVWFQAGVERWVIDNSAAAPDAFFKVRDYVKRHFHISCHGEGLLFGKNGAVSSSAPSVHTDAIMDASFPDLHNDGAGRVVILASPGRSIDDVIASMQKWHKRGFSIEYWGTLHAAVLDAWRSLDDNA